MQEELERKTVALAFNAGKFTIEELLNAMKKAVDSGIKHIPKSKEPKGEMTLKELIGKGNKAEGDPAMAFLAERAIGFCFVFLRHKIKRHPEQQAE